MLTFSLASAIVDAALAEGGRLKLAPLAAAALDAGGHLVALKREDGEGIARFDIAFAKAWGSLGMGFGSRELSERAAQNPTFIATLFDDHGRAHGVLAGRRDDPRCGSQKRRRLGHIGRRRRQRRTLRHRRCRGAALTAAPKTVA